MTATASTWLWAQWVVASAVPWPVWIVLHKRFASDTFPDALFSAVPIFLLTVGTLTGILQALVLRRYLVLDEVWTWPITTTFGLVFGAPASFLIVGLVSTIRLGGTMPFRGSTWSALLVGVIVGGLLGVFQRPRLRSGLPNAKTWLVLSPLAWAIAGVVAAHISAHWTGAVFGAITGVWLARVLPGAVSQRVRSP